MTIISNTFALACRHLLSKYTISTLQSIDITDNQYDYQCILKFSRFQRVKKERLSKRFSLCLCQGKAPGQIYAAARQANYIATRPDKRAIESTAYHSWQAVVADPPASSRDRGSALRSAQQCYE